MTTGMAIVYAEELDDGRQILLIRDEHRGRFYGGVGFLVGYDIDMSWVHDDSPRPPVAVTLKLRLDRFSEVEPEQFLRERAQRRGASAVRVVSAAEAAALLRLPAPSVDEN